MRKLSAKRLIQLCCISSASLLYYVPYAISTFYEAFEQAFQATNTQLGMLTSAYTTTTVLTYFLGGIVADKFSSRKLLALSYIATGALCVWYSTFPSYNISLFIMCAMGVTTTLTFWAAMLKATRVFAGEGNDGLGMGAVEGVRNVLSSIVATIAVIFFGRFTDIVLGLRFVILLFAVINILVGIAIIFVLEKDEPEDPEDGGIAKYLKTCLKDPNIWLASLIIFCFFIPWVGIRYLTPYATKVFGLSVALGALLGTFKEYMRPIGAFFAAYTSDRYGVSKMLMIFAIALAIINLGITIIPPGESYAIVVFIGGALGYVVLGAVRGIYFATVGDANIPIYMSGTAIGIMSTIGFLPDSFMPIIVGNILDKYPEHIGYPRVFMISAIFSIVAGIVTYVFYRKNKENIEHNLEKKRALRAKEKAEKVAANNN